MKKQIFKLLGISLLAITFSVNLTSSMDLIVGGEQVQARTFNGSPCHGSSNWNPFKTYTKCNTCSTENGRGTGTESTCTNSNPVEN